MKIYHNILLISPAIVRHTTNVLSYLDKVSTKTIRPGISRVLHLGDEIVRVSGPAPALFKALFMRIVAHGIAFFKDPVALNRLKRIMFHQSSCKRSAYQAIHKQYLTGNNIKIYCKTHYMPLLNQRYVADAVSEALKIKQKHVLFGGKRLWDKFLKGSISKKKWQHARNNTLYSRGDRTKLGNPNIRVVGNQLWVNDPETGWIKGKIWLNKQVNPACYESRIQCKDGKFHVTISWDEPDSPIVTDKSLGVIGVDTNPNGLALSEINPTGNLQSHIFLKNDRIQFAQTSKRDYDIKQMAIKAVQMAKQAGKPLVLEQLQFKNGKKSKKFNRMRSNFIYRRLIEAIKSRASKEGVEIIEVPAAYTSIVGKLKYQDMYSLSIHNAAAFVIGRLGFLNKADKVMTDVSGVGAKLTLEARGQAITLTKKSFLWFNSKFRVKIRDGSYQKLPALTAPCLAPG